jgi:hypothetical protein
VTYLLFLSDFDRSCNVWEKILENIPSMKFHENSSSGSRAVPCGQKGLRTDRHEEANSGFANAPEDPVVSNMCACICLL